MASEGLVTQLRQWQGKVLTECFGEQKTQGKKYPWSCGQRQDGWMDGWIELGGGEGGSQWRGGAKPMVLLRPDRLTIDSWAVISYLCGYYTNEL